jgi:hypothetical protein
VSIRHLVDIDVKLIRCDRLAAMSPELELIIWVKDEQPRKILNPLLRFHMLLLDERFRVLAGLRVATAV